MGSHSVTCHPAELRIPPLPPAEAGTRFSDPAGIQNWVDLCYLKATGRELNLRPVNRKSSALPQSHHVGHCAGQFPGSEWLMRSEVIIRSTYCTFAGWQHAVITLWPVVAVTWSLHVDSHQLSLQHCKWTWMVNSGLIYHYQEIDWLIRVVHVYHLSLTEVTRQS